jgi:hypothetical protein
MYAISPLTLVPTTLQSKGTLLRNTVTGKTVIFWILCIKYRRSKPVQVVMFLTGIQDVSSLNLCWDMTIPSFGI